MFVNIDREEIGKKKVSVKVTENKRRKCLNKTKLMNILIIKSRKEKRKIL